MASLSPAAFLPIRPFPCPLLSVKLRPFQSAKSRHCTPSAHLSASRRTILRLLPLPLLTLLPSPSPAYTTTTYIDPILNPPLVTTRVFFDIAIASRPPKRIIIACFGALVPATVANFAALASATPPAPSYADTDVYRVVPGLTVQLGDVLHNAGRSGVSAAGPPLEAEGTRLLHTMPGIVSMVRGPDGRTDSRFFIATRDGDSGYLDVDGRRYVGFGIVEGQGMDVVKEIEAVGARGGDSKPLKRVTIVKCGVL